MLLQDRFCGYCETPLLMDTDECSNAYCDKEPYVPNHYPFHYSATALIQAESFLDSYPEFREHQNLHYANRIGAYDSPEQDDYILPTNYDSNTHPIVESFLTETTREDEWDGIYASRDNYQREQITYWKDVEPTRCTSVTYWWTNRSSFPGYPVPYATGHVPHLKVRNQKSLFTLEETYAQRYQGLDYSEQALTNLEFEELQGFASEQLIDFNITERYQYRFFNIYRGNDTLLHVGLLTISDHEVKCSRGDCYFRSNPKAIPDTTDRSVQESFIHDIIRHGNNHGPDWYINREDFAFIHAENCNTHHYRTESCNALSPKVSLDLTTLEGSLDFLIRHRKFCTDSRCRCTAYYHSLSYYERALQAA